MVALLWYIIQALAKMLEANDKIEELIAASSQAGKEHKCGKVGAEALARGLKVNKTLTKLVLTGIKDIDDDDKDDLQRAVERPQCELVF